ncbi:hypothetical protein [uncultured Chitinophaga sp.]|uniref:hypothetical protein n=1 Tax=uncultured Chitinophaga sp. TaxID=339340 RepID=UPI0025DEAC7E|nr:hypothetical protein [uncultured Chitinophaga sp.]
MALEDLKKADYAKLLDMLAQHTSDVMTLLKDGSMSKEYFAKKAMIRLLMTEIERRKDNGEANEVPENS